MKREAGASIEKFWRTIPALPRNGKRVKANQAPLYDLNRMRLRSDGKAIRRVNPLVSPETGLRLPIWCRGGRRGRPWPRAFRFSPSSAHSNQPLRGCARFAEKKVKRYPAFSPLCWRSTIFQHPPKRKNLTRCGDSHGDTHRPDRRSGARRGYSDHTRDMQRSQAHSVARATPRRGRIDVATQGGDGKLTSVFMRGQTPTMCSCW